MTRVNSGPSRVDPSLGSCDFFVSCDSVVPLKRDSNHLSSLPGIPLPLHAGLLSCVPAGTWFHSTRTCLAYWTSQWTSKKHKSSLEEHCFRKATTLYTQKVTGFHQYRYTR